MTTALIVLAGGLSAALTAWLARRGHHLARLDQPNERTLHDVPVPRVGGLAVLTAAVACGVPAWVWLGGGAVWAWVGGPALLVAVVSYLDDRRPLPAWLRFGVHLVAAGTVAIGVDASTALPLPAWPAGAAVVLVVLTITWSANLFNFMDGMDGFAGGMAAIGFATCAVVADAAGAGVLAALSGIVAAASAGFLVFNFPPARIFLGDVGSTTLGFLAATIGLVGVAEHAWTWPVPVLVFSPFGVDATVTLLRRAVRGERVWRPHRTHFYQRLVQAGWGHRRTVLWEYVVMLASSLTAVSATRASSAAWGRIAMAWTVVYVVLVGLVTLVERAHARESDDRG
jgi:UDP-N-acetylmuramyl pentapeptide phosphotransferase/UDP-N-acetylglucosamine-1-phosphate transferase